MVYTMSIVEDNELLEEGDGGICRQQDRERDRERERERERKTNRQTNGELAGQSYKHADRP
jgi:hypothetical protein